MADEFSLDEGELARLYAATGWAWWMGDEALIYLLWRSQRQQAREANSMRADKSLPSSAGREAPCVPAPAAQRPFSALGNAWLSLLAAMHLRAH